MEYIKKYAGAFIVGVSVTIAILAVWNTIELRRQVSAHAAVISQIVNFINGAQTPQE